MPEQTVNIRCHICGIWSVSTLIATIEYIDDIYSLAVNTINIVIECNENIALVKIWMFSLHEMKIFMIFTEKE